MQGRGLYRDGPVRVDRRAPGAVLRDACSRLRRETMVRRPPHLGREKRSHRYQSNSDQRPQGAVLLPGGVAARNVTEPGRKSAASCSRGDAWLAGHPSGHPRPNCRVGAAIPGIPGRLAPLEAGRPMVGRVRRLERRRVMGYILERDVAVRAWAVPKYLENKKPATPGTSNAWVDPGPS